LSDAPRIVVHGAGAVGCWIGATWAASGLDVAFLGRPGIAAEIAADGMTVTDCDGGRIELPGESVRFHTRPRALKDADIILLAVKGTGTAEAAKEIARHARADVTVLSFQNGVSNPDLLRAALPRATVLPGMVPFNVVHLGRGHWHKSVSGMLVAQDHDATRSINARLGSRPGAMRLEQDMKSIAWGKLLINLNNAVNALSGLPLLAQLRDRNYRRVLAASMIEALEVLTAAGIEPAKAGPIPPRLLPHAIAAPDFVFRNLLLRTMKIDESARSSMADDFAAGRPTEIDMLNGEVVRLANSLKRGAPVNAAIVALVKQAELGVERTWSSADLRAHVLERHKGAPGFGY
jgi:2-dehydropantoate 2-reductase